MSKTTGLMESGPATLSGFKFDKHFSTPLRSILISGIVGQKGFMFLQECVLERSCVYSVYTAALTSVGISVNILTEI